MSQWTTGFDGLRGVDYQKLREGAAQARGPTPTVLIGLGGTGCQVLLRVRRRFYERYMRCDYPPLAYVAIDTCSQPERLRNAGEYLAQRTSFDPKEYVFAGVSGADIRNYNRLPQNFPLIKPWLPLPFPLSRIDDGVGGFRPAGRLAFFHKENYLRIKRTIEAAVERVTDPRVTDEFHDLNMAMSQFIVVCSLAGGTGTGMFLDMGMLLRRWLFTRVGFFVLPGVHPPQIHDRHLVNSYAALKELEMFQGGDTPDDSYRRYQHPDGSGDEVTDPLFRFAYLVGPSNELGQTLKHTDDDRESLFEAIAEAIFWDVHPQGDFSPTKRQVRFQLDGGALQSVFYHTFRDQAGQARYTEVFRSRYMSFGCSKLELPIERLLERCAYRRALQILDHWLRERPVPEPPEKWLLDTWLRGTQIDPRQIRSAITKGHAGDERLVQQVGRWRAQVLAEAVRRRREGDAASAYLARELEAAERRWFDPENTDPAQSVVASFAMAREGLLKHVRADLAECIRARLHDAEGGPKFLATADPSKRAAQVLPSPAATDAEKKSVQALPLLENWLKRTIQEQHKKIDALNGRLRAYRDAFTRTCEELRFVEDEWNIYHPLRRRTFPVLIERAVPEGHMVLRIRLQIELEQQVLAVLLKLERSLPSHEREIVSLLTLLGDMRSAVQAQYENVRRIQPPQNLFVEVSANDEEDAFYEKACQVRGNVAAEVDGRKYLKSLGGSDPEATLLVLNEIHGHGQPAEDLTAQLLEHCHRAFNRIGGSLSVHVLDYEKDGQPLWPRVAPLLARRAMAWISKGQQYTGDAQEAVMGYNMLGIEPNQQATVFKERISGVLPDMLGELGQESSARPHAAILLREIGGFPLLYLSGIEDWFRAYQKSPEWRDTHLDPRFANLKDLRLITPEDFQELTETYESLLLGTILGVMRRVKDKDTEEALFEAQRPSGIGVKTYVLGNEQEAFRGLRDPNTGRHERHRILSEIRSRYENLNQRDMAKLLKVIDHYLQRCATPVTEADQKTQRRLIHADVLERWSKDLATELGGDERAKEEVSKLPPVEDLAEDPCQDGWLVMKSLP